MARLNVSHTLKVGDKVRMTKGETGDYFVSQDSWFDDGVGEVTEVLTEGSIHLVKVSGIPEVYRDAKWDSSWWDLVESTPMPSGRYLPDDDAVRRDYPLFDALFGYFPAALCEVARWSKVGGAKHNDGELRWVREVSTDHKNKILRHLLDADKEVDDGFIEAVALAWRSLALCQSLLEKRGWPEGENAKWK